MSSEKKMIRSSQASNFRILFFYGNPGVGGFID